MIDMREKAKEFISNWNKKGFMPEYVVKCTEFK